MADVLPSREDGHLAVAAIRVLRHQQGRPPSPAEIEKLLGWGDEQTHVVLRGLVGGGILRMHETPFDAHFEIDDHGKLDDLLPEAEQSALGSEVDEFKQRARSRQDKMADLLASGDLKTDKSKEMESLEKQFAEFKKKAPRPPMQP